MCMFQPQMFERAVHCFPQPDCSVDLETAIQAHAHVLLTWYVESVTIMQCMKVHLASQTYRVIPHILNTNFTVNYIWCILLQNCMINKL